MPVHFRPFPLHIICKAISSGLIFLAFIYYKRVPVHQIKHSYIHMVQPTRCAFYLKLFILVKRSTCFGRSFRPSSGAQNFVYSNGICQTAAAVAAAVWHIPLLYTKFWAPDDGRKDRPKHVERFTRINNWDKRCILLAVLYEYITMHGPTNIKSTQSCQCLQSLHSQASNP